MVFAVPVEIVIIIIIIVIIIITAFASSFISEHYKSYVKTIKHKLQVDANVL